MTDSSQLQIRLERLDRNFERRIARLAPQFAAVEQHRVDPLRVFTFADRNHVGIDVTAADGFDDAGLAARVARQPRVSLRVNVFGAHLVAWLKTRGSLRGAGERAARQCVGYIRGLHRSLECLAGPQRMAGRNLISVCQTLLDQKILQPQLPFPVVRAPEIYRRRQALDAGPRLVDRPDAGITQRAVDRVGASLPGSVKHRLVRLRLDFAEAVHAAHVVNAVHQAASFGFFASPVPIMLSRVTSAASFSSLQLSVPAGRIGSTMKRVSAVESQTRISVSVGSVTPKSASTPRGSLTARDR